MPASSPADPSYDLAVVALSARALARSARRAGLRALAIDLFADEDTREHAATALRVAPHGRGLNRRALLAALRDTAPEGLPVVFGAGFEHAPALMRRIGLRNPILGAAPETVATLKQPAAFAALLAELGIPHPEIGLENDAGAGPWLSKRAGSSGGAHIRPSRDTRGGRYLQRRVEGRAVSALFLADGAGARIVGFSEQWSDPTPRAPHRYGGAVGPVGLPPPLLAGVAEALDRLVAATGLRGLASADLIVPETDDAMFWLIEINPRPGATLDIFDRGETPSLLGLHIAASNGRLPDALPTPVSAQAAAVVYAPCDVTAGLLRRPVWTADWPACEETVPAGAPVCTVLAAGATPSAARALLAERRASLLKSLDAAVAGPERRTVTVHP